MELIDDAAARRRVVVPAFLDERDARLPRHEAVESTRGRALLMIHPRSSHARPWTGYFVRSRVSATGAFFLTEAMPASIAFGVSYISLFPTT